MTKWYRRALGVLTAMFLILIGTYGGIKVKEYIIDLQEDRSTINTIAVVNLDEGIQIEGEKINYAMQLMVYPDVNFVSAGLEDARTGITSDRYAAYITIPSSFSRSTVSINTQPEKAIVEYKINPNLREDIKIDVVSDVNNFLWNLSNNLSYVYLDAILKEFHSAQDSANTIMNNDNKDMENILDIQSEKLIQVVEFPTIVPIKDEIESLDLSANYNSAEETVTKINTDYEEYIQKGIETFVAIKEKEAGVTEAITKTVSSITEIDIEKDAGGNVVYEEGTNELNTIVMLASEELEQYKLNAMVLLGHTPTLTSMEQPQRAEGAGSSKPPMKQFSLNLKESLSKEVVEKSETNPAKDTMNHLEINTEKDTVENPRIESDKETVENQETNPDTGTVGNPESNSDKNTVENPEANPDKGTAGNPELNPEKDTVENPESNVEKDTVENPVTDQGKKTVENAEIESESTMQGTPTEGDGGTGSKTAIGNLQDENSGANIQEDIKIQVDTIKAHIQKSNQTIEDKIKEIEKEIEAPSVSDNSIVKGMLSDIESSLIEEESIRVDVSAKTMKIAALLESIPEMDISSIEEVISKQIVEPIQNECLDEADQVQSTATELQTQMTAYQQELAAYDPLQYVDQSSISTSLGSLHSNITSMESKISETNSKNTEYVANVYTSSNENVTELQENMQEANSSTNQNINSMVQFAKQNREIINQQNTQVLTDLTKKLPYTRLGTMEYTETYDFIAEPIIAEGNYQLNTKNLKREITIMDVDKVIIVTMAVLLILIFVIIVIIKVKIRIKKEDNEDSIIQNNLYL